MSGGSALAAADLAVLNPVSGTGSDKIWDDLDGIEAIRSLIKQYSKRVVDNYMLSVAKVHLMSRRHLFCLRLFTAESVDQTTREASRFPSWPN